MTDSALKNKIAIVTGSTEGIGLAVALLFAERGMRVYINGRNENKAEDAMKLFREKNLSVSLLVGDAADESFVQESVKAVIEEKGKIDILINNVGVCIYRPIDLITLEEWNAQLTTNLTSVFLWSKEVIPHMKKASSGKIISIASTGGTHGLRNAAPYNAAKGGILAFTKGLAKDLEEFNISVDAVVPGPVFTEGLQKAFPTLARHVPDNIIQPGEIANAIFSLVTSSGTGRIVVIDKTAA